MKIYTKILLVTLPLIIISLLAAVSTTYYFSHNALTDLTEKWLETRLCDAVQAATEREEMLRRYSLENMAASVKQAKLDAGAAMLSIEILEQGYIFVVDSHGIIVVHPDKSMKGRNVNKKIWFREINQNQKKRLEYSSQGVSHLAMYKYFGPWQWYILATAPESEVYRAINRMGRYVLLLGALGPLLMALALMFMTRRLTKPFRLLAAGAKKIGEGRLKTRISIHTRDELGSLADVFNKMAGQLQETLTALQKSEKYFRSLIENISDIITVLDKDGMIRYASPSNERILGYKEEDLIGRNVFEFVHPDNREDVIAVFNQQLQIPGITPPVEFRFLCKDGSWLIIEAVGSNLFEDSAMAGMVINSRDITERKRSEEALAAEKERLSVTLRSIGDGVITTDVEGKIVLMNRVSEALTGWTNKEAIGRPLPDVFHIIDEKTRQRSENPVKNVIKTEGIAVLSSHTVLVARDGAERIIADSGAPIFDKDSKIIGVVLVFQDITEKRKTEEELLKTQKLESIGLLAGGIAHDFNNILTGIIGNISLAKKYAKPGDKIFERLEKTKKISLGAKDLTRQLLTFSKGGKPIKKTIAISDLIFDSAGFALRGANVRCDFLMPNDLWPVEIDEGQMGQVINNLIINANQAMPKGGMIKLSTENLTITATNVLPLKPGRYIKISIRDQGIGIQKDHLLKIFDPYFTTKQKGTGLGLTTVYSIIDKHDGYITAESEPGMGTTFHIYLPASKKEITKAKDIETHILTGKGKVLVMDDDEYVRDIAGEMLEHLEYEVVFAKDGTEAIEMYRKNPFNVVIMDLTIPGGMGGKEAVKKLLEIDSKARVIVSSGYSNDPVMANFEKYGFSGVVSKPYEIEELSKALYKVIAGKK